MIATLTATQAAVLATIATYVGVDLHKTTVTLAAVDADGQTVDILKINTKCRDAITKWLAALPQPLHVAVEACPFVEWFIDAYRPMVEQLGGRFDIADATELANLRGKRRKNDRNDALDIARRLARGECPLGWIAPPEFAHIRKLGRQWHRLSRMMSSSKHTMRSILLAANISGPSRLTGTAAHKWLLAHGAGLLKPADYHSFGELLEIVMLIERQRETLRRRIIEACRHEDIEPIVRRLKSVPGIDVIWACIIAAEVGDFARFPNADTLEFWTGLTPDNEESAGRTTSGNITKAGSRTLRWALGKAAGTLCRSDKRMEAKRQRLIDRIGLKPKANVAMARHLVTVLYAMFRDRTDYQAGGATGHTEKANRARARQRSIHRRRPVKA